MRAFLAALAVATAGTLSLAPLAAGAADAPLDRKAVEKIVHDYILEHPEIITEAVGVLQQREEEAQKQAAAKAVSDNAKELYESKSSPVGGNPKGDVTFVEFFDYQCGYCKAAQPEVEAALKGDGKIKVVYKEFPILGPASLTAAKAALASQNQGKYEAFHRALMANKARLDDALIMKIAADTGLDTARLQKDMESDAVKKEIDANMELARKLGIRGTPAFAAGNTLIPGLAKQDDITGLFRQARGEAQAGPRKG
jgi:protein-disulfide isomerase